MSSSFVDPLLRKLHEVVVEQLRQRCAEITTTQELMSRSTLVLGPMLIGQNQVLGLLMITEGINVFRFPVAALVISQQLYQLAGIKHLVLAGTEGESLRLERQSDRWDFFLLNTPKDASLPHSSF